MRRKVAKFLYNFCHFLSVPGDAQKDETCNDISCWLWLYSTIKKSLFCQFLSFFEVKKWPQRCKKYCNLHGKLNIGCWHRRKNEASSCKYRPWRQLSTSEESNFDFESAQNAELSKIDLQTLHDASQSGHFNEQIPETFEKQPLFWPFRLRHPSKIGSWDVSCTCQLQDVPKVLPRCFRGLPRCSQNASECDFRTHQCPNAVPKWY